MNVNAAMRALIDGLRNRDPDDYDQHVGCVLWWVRELRGYKPHEHLLLEACRLCDPNGDYNDLPYDTLWDCFVDLFDAA